MEPITIEIDGKKYIVMSDDGKPMYNRDGKEIAVDVPGTFSKISELQGEAKGHRLAKEEAEGKLKGFEGIDDPAAARKALETVGNLDDKQLVDAGEIERVKAEAIAAVEEKYKPVVEERDQLKTTLNGEMIGGRFARSKYIGENLAIPADMVESRFGSNFKIEDGNVVAYDNSGNLIYSKANPGDRAGFEEALEILVDHYPHKDTILKGSGKTGTGATGADGKTGKSGKPVMARSEFDKLDPSKQADLMVKGEVELVEG